MNKIELNNVLNQKFKHLIEWVENQEDREFEVHHIPVKWSTGQHIDHLRKTTKAVNIGISMNSLILRYKFGKLNRNEMSYEEVKNNYVEKSGDGVVAPPSFTPKEIAESIKKYIPDFKITYRPDERQAIADSWSNSIDDAQAKADWGWAPKFDLDGMTRDMLFHLKGKYSVEGVDS